MLESFLAKYGYIAILLGTAFEGETIMIMGGNIGDDGEKLTKISGYVIDDHGPEIPY